MTIQNDDFFLVNRGDQSNKIKYEKIKDDILGDVQAGIVDAPVDGNMYGRRNQEWQEIVHNTYSNSDVDAHLNTGLASGGQILSWSGTDYQWVADQTGGGGGSSDASLVSYQYPGGVSRTVESRLRDRVSVKDFGAKGDGSTDDHTALQAAIDSTMASGEVLYFPAGTYMTSNRLRFQVKAVGCEVYCAEGVTIKASSNFPQNVKFVDVTVHPDFNSTMHSFTWTGGTLDGTLMPVRTAAAPDVMDVYDGAFDHVVLSRIDFIANRPDFSGNQNEPPTLGNATDTCLGLGIGKNFYVEHCKFIGAVDAGIYISGLGDTGEGENCTITDCYFAYNRQAGVITKRKFKNQIISNNVFENERVGFATAAVGDDAPFYGPGFKCLVTGNTFLNTELSAVDIRHSDNTIVSNNIIENVGFKVAVNGNIFSYSDPECFGIGIRGSDSCAVSGNIIFTDTPYISGVKNPPNYNNDPNRPRKIYAIFLDGYENSNRSDFRTTDYTSVTGNMINSFRYGIWEQADGAVEALNNNVTNNHTKGVNEDYNLEHNGSYYEWTDHAEGDHIIAFGSEATPDAGRIMHLKRARGDGRRGEVVVGNSSNDHDLHVYGDIRATNNITANTSFSLRQMGTALNAIAAAANDSYSDLQQFKNAIKQALEGLNDD